MIGFFRKKDSTPTTRKRRILKLQNLPAATYAVGDIHGCLDLYEALERKIVADGANFPGPKLIVCLGDIVDRGPASAGVVEKLSGPAPAGFQRVVLCGNHEAMMSDFLQEPERHQNWLGFGGDETLYSYGLKADSGTTFIGEGAGLRHKLNVGIPDTHRKFLDGLPMALEMGKWRFAHAGYDLGKPAEAQHVERLLWGPAQNGKPFTGSEVLVHGHVIVPDIALGKSHINVDIGAYSSGRLAAVRIIPSVDDIEVFICERDAGTGQIR